MTETYLGYHKTHTYEKFHGENYFTRTDIPVESEIFIVSGDYDNNSDPINYYLEGKYQVKNVKENLTSSFENQKNHLTLKQISSPSKPRLLNTIEGFDKKSFHDNFTSNQPAKKISGSQEYLVELFDQLLDFK